MTVGAAPTRDWCSWQAKGAREAPAYGLSRNGRSVHVRNGTGCPARPSSRRATKCEATRSRSRHHEPSRPAPGTDRAIPLESTLNGVDE